MTRLFPEARIWLFSELFIVGKESGWGENDDSFITIVRPYGLPPRTAHLGIPEAFRRKTAQSVAIQTLGNNSREVAQSSWSKHLFILLPWSVSLANALTALPLLHRPLRPLIEGENVASVQTAPVWELCANIAGGFKRTRPQPTHEGGEKGN